MPADVVIVETTYGGTISAMCHGAGITNKTLSDLVAEVEFVDPNGELRTVSDPELLKAASGTMGVLGVVTAYTIRLDKMTYAAMRPARVPVELAVPPPQEYIDAARKGDPKYKWIKDLVAQHSQKTIDDAATEFIRQCEKDYYTEWIWFPLARDVWVNTWNNDGAEAESKPVPTDFQITLEWIEGWLAEVILNWSVTQALPGELQAKLFAFIGSIQGANVKKDDPTRTFLHHHSLT
jgi:FAD/FMN-containing dehydrogenase